MGGEAVLRVARGRFEGGEAGGQRGVQQRVRREGEEAVVGLEEEGGEGWVAGLPGVHCLSIIVD